MVSQVSLHDFISSSVVLRQVSLGRPLFCFPSGVQRRAILGSASAPVISIFSTVWVRDFAFVLWRSSSYEILLGQNILRIFQNKCLRKILRSKHLFWKVCILWAILVVSFHHSAPYSKPLRTLLLKILRLVLVPTCFDFQMFFSMAKDWFAFVILELTSLSESPSVAILLPRYVNSFTSSVSQLFMVTGSFDL